MAIWPPEYKNRSIDELPKPGLKSFSVTVKKRVVKTTELNLDMDPNKSEEYERVQQWLLKWAHSIGEPEVIFERAAEMLSQSCFLLHWIAFEGFLRATINELFRRHPEVLTKVKQSNKPSLSYEDVFKLTGGFTEMNSLQNSIIDLEIQKHEASGMSVHGLINFLKDVFNFKCDLYKSKYIYRNAKETTSYNDLVEFKEVRNELVHRAGFASPDFLNTYTNVPNRDGRIIISQDYYQKSSLIIGAITSNIAHSIKSKKYNIST